VLIRGVSSRDIARLKDLRVLLIGNQPHIRSVLLSILATLGISNVSTVDSAIVAVEYMVSERFDLIITDDAMVGMSGVDLATLVRGDGRRAVGKFDYQIPILMIADHITRTRLDQIRDAGIDEVLAKPFTVAAVAGRLVALVNQRREFIVSATYVGPCRRRASSVSYRGQMRRSSDQADLCQTQITTELQFIRKEARALCELANKTGRLVRTETQAALAIALSIATRASKMRYPLLIRAVASLTKYVRWAAGMGVVDCDVVALHGHTFSELLELQVSDMSTATLVTQSLEQAVAKRMSRSTAA
jgi:CheY-like chemotaxis protein